MYIQRSCEGENDCERISATTGRYEGLFHRPSGRFGLGFDDI